MNIVLIGMSGSGKTTVGCKLASKTEMDFFDIDEMIVENENKSIDSIFKVEGEEYFRDLESKEIMKCSQKHNSVISTGGGAILRKSNMNALKTGGYVILLEASIDTLIRNLESSNIIRPLLNNSREKKNDMENMYKERKELYYSYADSIINIDNKSIDEIIDEITSLEEIGAD